MRDVQLPHATIAEYNIARDGARPLRPRRAGGRAGRDAFSPASHARTPAGRPHGPAIPRDGVRASWRRTVAFGHGRAYRPVVAGRFAHGRSAGSARTAAKRDTAGRPSTHRPLADATRRRGISGGLRSDSAGPRPGPAAPAPAGTRRNQQGHADSQPRVCPGKSSHRRHQRRAPATRANRVRGPRSHLMKKMLVLLLLAAVLGGLGYFLW